VGRQFYLLPLLILALTVALSVLPLFTDAERFIFNPNFLIIIYALLALAISVFTFGFLGDSDAFIDLESTRGLSLQVTGSAAGFAVFFYLFASGLSPYSSLTVYLLNEDGDPLGPRDGRVEVTIAGDVRRNAATENGSVTFAYLPRSEDRKLLVSAGSWAIAGVDAPDCMNEDGLVRAGCSAVYLTMRREMSCLEDMSLTVVDPRPVSRTLDQLLKEFEWLVQAGGTPLGYQFSREVRARNLHMEPFEIKRQSSEMTGCQLLEEIERVYNNISRQAEITIYASCRHVYVAMTENDPPSEGFKACSRLS
jgi:hypothetical protein